MKTTDAETQKGDRSGGERRRALAEALRTAVGEALAPMEGLTGSTPSQRWGTGTCEGNNVPELGLKEKVFA